MPEELPKNNFESEKLPETGLKPELETFKKPEFQEISSGDNTSVENRAEQKLVSQETAEVVRRAFKEEKERVGSGGWKEKLRTVLSDVSQSAWWEDRLKNLGVLDWWEVYQDEKNRLKNEAISEGESEKICVQKVENNRRVEDLIVQASLELIQKGVKKEINTERLKDIEAALHATISTLRESQVGKDVARYAQAKLRSLDKSWYGRYVVPALEAAGVSI